MVEAWSEPPPALWQWEHRTGFKDYDEATCQRIESAYLRGNPYVRLKTGKTRSTPMELFFADMIQHDPITGNRRNIRRSRPDRWHEFMRRKLGELVHALDTGKKYRMRFEQYIESRKEVLDDLDRKEYAETNLYKDSGCCAAVACHPSFGFASMAAVVLNALWLGVDVNFNKAATIWQADAGFQLVEHTFSVIFTVELAIRFGALRLKSHIVQDGWLCFDLVLVAVMVGENLVMLPIYLANGDNTDATAFGDVSIFRLARLLRLTRITRVARLLRGAPEVLTMLKAITTALRTVTMTAMLLIVLVYLFGLVFKIQSNSYPELSAFPTVGTAMWALLLHGTFLDAVADLVYEMKDISWILTFIFMVFVFLSNLTILNMLVGILCEVATEVEKREKEQGAVSYLKHNLIEILEVHDKNDDRHINKDDFELLMHNPEMHFILKNFGVDTEDLLSLQDILFETKTMVVSSAAGDLDDSGMTEVTNSLLRGSKTNVFQTDTKRLRFAEFLDVVLRLRGGNGASVRDVVDLREYLRQRIDHLAGQLPKLPLRVAGDESSPHSQHSPLRVGGAAGFESPSAPSLREAGRPDDVMEKLLEQIQAVREDVRAVRVQMRVMEDSQKASLKLETQVSDASDICNLSH